MVNLPRRLILFFPKINEKGFGFDYLEKLMVSSFYYGQNIGEDKYLEKTVSDLGLSWSELKKELANNDWKEILNNNLEDMYKGLLGGSNNKIIEY